MNDGTADTDPAAPWTVAEPTTGRPVLMAPQRQHRPHHMGTAASFRPCPFCPGSERETPPEIDAERAPGTGPDQPGWIARAVPNKYPANDCHEVFVEGDRHCEQPADLGVEAWRRCIALWRRRIQAIEARPGMRCAFLFKNVGASAGASIEHNHSQVIGLAELPPRLVLEQRLAATAGACPWCRTAASAAAEQRLVHATADHVVVVPDPPKLPYEAWLLPVACDDDFLTTDVDSLAVSLQALFSAVAGGLARPAFNLWLHRIPGARFHWHFELQPRTGQLAGLELGGDMYINSVPARAAAARLRAGLASG